MDTSDHEPEPMQNTVPPASAPVHPFGWEWGREEDRRPQLPWIGIFLVVYGALLLIERLASQYLVAGNLLVLAAGLAFLIVWLLRRGTFPLYAGAFLTASAIPGLWSRRSTTSRGPGSGRCATAWRCCSSGPCA